MIQNIKIEEKNLERLNIQKEIWRTLSDKEKINHIDLCMKNLKTVSEKWVDLCTSAKKILKTSQTVGQEWISGPVVLMRALRILKYSFLSNKHPNLKITQSKNEQYRAHVVPKDFYESILFQGIKAEVLIEKGRKPTQGEYLSQVQNQKGSLCLVLGAGNVASMPALDILNKLFAHNCVCLLKFNPVNAYIHDVFKIIFKSLIDEGFLALTIGDKETGQFLCGHSLVDEIHVTGSFETYKAIAKHSKKISAELGCVTPALIVPGLWKQKDILFQAKQIASAVENNASFNCNAIKVLVVSKHWSQKNNFMNALREEFKKMPSRYAYYPASWERYQTFLKHYPNAEVLGSPDLDQNTLNNYGLTQQNDSHHVIPWTLIPDVKISPDEYALKTEAFCGILSIVEIDTKDTSEFIQQSVEVCNSSIWGNLSCSLIVDPGTQKTYHSEIESALNNLKYGSIGLNCWAALSYGLFTTTWGAYPEEEVESGIGFINNGYFFDYPEKSIIRSSFRPLLKPVWFYDHKNLVSIGKNLVNFEYSQNFSALIKLVLSALKS